MRHPFLQPHPAGTRILELWTTGEAAPCDNGRGGPLRACGHPRLNFGHGKLKEPESAEFVL